MFKRIGLEKSEESEKMDGYALSLLFIVLSLILMVFPRLLSLTTTPHYLLTPFLSGLSLAIYVCVSFLWFYLPVFLQKEAWIVPVFLSSLVSDVLVILGAFYADMFYLDTVLRHAHAYDVLNQKIVDYLSQEKWFYGLLLVCLSGHLILFKKMFDKKQLRVSSRFITISLPIFLLLIPLFVAQPLSLMNVHLFIITQATTFFYLPLTLKVGQNSLYALLTLGSVAWLMRRHPDEPLDLAGHKKINDLAGVLTTLCLLFQSLLGLLPYLWLAHRTGQSAYRWMAAHHVMLIKEGMTMMPLLFTLWILSCFKKTIKNKMFDETADRNRTTGHFGSASWALTQDLIQLHAYRATNGIPIGMDQQGQLLYLPLCNKLTISPPGGGKTTASSMLVLLTHPGPVFVWDIKGELWAVTVNYRTRVLKRQVIVIDPYGLTKSPDFAKDKEESLLAQYTINPFDWIPEDKKQRDRMLNTLAAAFVVNEGGTATHFDDNAKILIRGYIDYLMHQAPESRSLPMLYRLMSESAEQAGQTFARMTQLDGRAAAAANQINRVGNDERGSILSTSYRQIDWMGDSNIQATLSTSNFDLRDFIKGNMDIFVVLPEDQVKEHNRLVRLLMALLMGMIVQAKPSELPQEKMLFLLEELAQLGYCPDVEQCIEVLRARGVVVWTVFQTLSQIELFQKADLFKGAPLKQIFTNDDTKTMEWIQTLGGKKTVLTKTLSNNTGDSRQKMQVWGGSLSSGEGESIHETGVDLIQLNQIRELHPDEQFIFFHSAKPIKCKKVRYFEHPEFKGKYDPNPLEKNSHS